MVSYSCPISMKEYVSLTRYERMSLHKQLGDFIESHNRAVEGSEYEAEYEGDNEAPAPTMSSMPRNMRKEGIY